jgi:cyclopropane-fatty-acyl-phospholipid synthase
VKTDATTFTLAEARLPRAPRAPLLTRMVLARLKRVETGILVLHEGGRRHVFGNSDPSLPAASVHVQDARFWSAVAARGSVGAGEAYAAGWWTSEDPTAVVRLFVRNRAALVAVEGGMAWLSRPALAVYHAFRRNTLHGSRANISAHYDLSNDFFRLFLDETMSYSSGIFERPDATLREASLAKIDRICRKLELGPKDNLLEIGTGWGALAIYAAREYGCRVTTTTISREQHALAAERIASADLGGRITLLMEDYRRLSGTYDKLVSVEMIEAVGHQYYDDFFRKCSSLLRPEGKMCLQTITIADQLFDGARRSVDFIQRHVFPGSCIPSITALCSSMTSASDLRPVHLEDFGLHYARTLAEWRRNLRERWNDARALGFSEERLRLWDFYFCYCEGGFAERQIGLAQLVVERPLAQPASFSTPRFA